MLTADGIVALLGQPWYVPKPLIVQSCPGFAMGAGLVQE